MPDPNETMDDDDDDAQYELTDDQYAEIETAREAYDEECERAWLAEQGRKKRESMIKAEADYLRFLIGVEPIYPPYRDYMRYYMAMQRAECRLLAATAMATLPPDQQRKLTALYDVPKSQWMR